MGDPQDEYDGDPEEKESELAIDDMDPESVVESATTGNERSSSVDLSSSYIDLERFFDSELDYLYTPYSDSILDSISRRPPSDSTYISESTAKYIINRSEENISKYEKRVEQTLEDLPLRITRLLYDIMLLWDGNYLNDIDENWEYLNIIPDDLSNTSEKVYNISNDVSDQDISFKLGYSMALGLSCLTGRVTEDDRGGEFLDGFSKGYLTDNLHRSDQEFAQEFSNSKSRDLHFYPSKEILDQYGMLPTQYLNKRFLEYKMIKEKILDEELPPERETRKFINEKLDDQFGECSLLRKKVKGEWENIEDANVPGIEIEEILRQLWEAVFDPDTGMPVSNGIKSKSIAEKCGKAGRYKNQVTQSFNRLSIDGKRPSENSKRTFENDEIIYYSDGGWKLNGYGELLLYCVFERDEDFSWIQQAGINISSRGWDEVTSNTKNNANVANKFDIENTISINEYQILQSGVDYFFN